MSMGSEFFADSLDEQFDPSASLADEDVEFLLGNPSPPPPLMENLGADVFQVTPAPQTLYRVGAIRGRGRGAEPGQPEVLPDFGIRLRRVTPTAGASPLAQSRFPSALARMVRSVSALGAKRALCNGGDRSRAGNAFHVNELR
jgi:hypothetical protein